MQHGSPYLNLFPTINFSQFPYVIAIPSFRSTRIINLYQSIKFRRRRNDGLERIVTFQYNVELFKDGRKLI